MQRTLLLISILVLNLSAAMAQCVGGDRYKAPIFAYDSVMDLVYGQNVTALSSTPIDLKLDIYLPANDTLQKRPLFFITHGGSFLFGSKADGDVVKLSREFAMRGYVCVSQDYRLGMESFNAQNASNAVWRAMQDARAAIRYMKANASLYNIDTNMIIYGGSSAGGFTALHTAFFDEPHELLPGIDTSEYTGPGSTGLGNFNGTTNNLPNSSKGIKAVVNLCGAIGDTSWIQTKDSSVVVISMHGTADATVPYGTAIIKLLNTIPLLKVDGSNSIHKYLAEKGYNNSFYTYCGSDHVPYAGFTPLERNLMDTTIQFIAKNLYEKVLKCGSSDIIIRDRVDSTDCPATGINNTLANRDFVIFPNPAHAEVNFRINSNETITCEIYSSNGRKVHSAVVDKNNSKIDISALSTGVYILKINSSEHHYFEKLIVN